MESLSNSLVDVLISNKLEDLGLKNQVSFTQIFLSYFVCNL